MVSMWDFQTLHLPDQLWQPSQGFPPGPQHEWITDITAHVMDSCDVLMFLCGVAISPTHSHTLYIIHCFCAIISSLVINAFLNNLTRAWTWQKRLIKKTASSARYFLFCCHLQTGSVFCWDIDMQKLSWYRFSMQWFAQYQFTVTLMNKNTGSNLNLSCLRSNTASTAAKRSWMFCKSKLDGISEENKTKPQPFILKYNQWGEWFCLDVWSVNSTCLLHCGTPAVNLSAAMFYHWTFLVRQDFTKIPRKATFQNLQTTPA